MFHTRCVLDTMCSALSPGAVRKLQLQLPEEFQSLFSVPVG
jgi:hypothetical protein